MNVPFRAILLASLFAISTAAAQTYTTLHDFSAGGGHTRRRRSSRPRTEASGARLTTAGVYGAGSIFTLTPDGLGGFTYAERHAFDGRPRRGQRIHGGTGAGLGRRDVRRQSRQSRIPSARSIASTPTAATSRRSTPSRPRRDRPRRRPSSRAPTADSTESRESGGASNFGTLFAFDPSDGNLHGVARLRPGSTARIRADLSRRNGRPALRDDALAAAPTFVGIVFVIDKSGDNFEVLLRLRVHERTISPVGVDPTGRRVSLRNHGHRAGNNAASCSRSTPTGDNFQQLHAHAGG